MMKAAAKLERLPLRCGCCRCCKTQMGRRAIVRGPRYASSPEAQPTADRHIAQLDATLDPQPEVERCVCAWQCGVGSWSWRFLSGARAAATGGSQRERYRHSSVCRIENLSSIDVTSTLKHAEPKSSGSAAAIEVMHTATTSAAPASRRCPRRCGSPPVLQVARFDGRTWAITARGFDISTANKLVVMIDRAERLHAALFRRLLGRSGSPHLPVGIAGAVSGVLRRHLPTGAAPVHRAPRHARSRRPVPGSPPGTRHDIVTGLGYMLTRSRTTPSPVLFFDAGDADVAARRTGSRRTTSA